MKILGIETSCDETSAAIIEGNKNEVTLLANVTATSLEMHGKTGGIIPEDAAREQLKCMLPVITESLKKADTTLEEIDAFAITYGPGLIGSLLVGVETIKTMSFVLNKPIIPVNHMLGHVYANWINRKEPIFFPAIALVVSGGHTDILLFKNHTEFTLLGGTRDDAAGECFDKSARLLGYSYPGGPHISKLAQKGNPNAFSFPRPMLGSKNYEFSFSGLKTAFLNKTKEHFPILRKDMPNSKVGWNQIVLENKLDAREMQTLYDLCASLEKAIVEVIVKKTIRAAVAYGTATILISGGVSANQLLRDTFLNETQKKDLKLIFPERALCTDNAAMIASYAYFHQQPLPWQHITADPELYF